MGLEGFGAASLGDEHGYEHGIRPPCRSRSNSAWVSVNAALFGFRMRIYLVHIILQLASCVCQHVALQLALLCHLLRPRAFVASAVKFPHLGQGYEGCLGPPDDPGGQPYHRVLLVRYRKDDFRTASLNNSRSPPTRNSAASNGPRSSLHTSAPERKDAGPWQQLAHQRRNRGGAAGPALCLYVSQHDADLTSREGRVSYRKLKAVGSRALPSRKLF